MVVTAERSTMAKKQGRPKKAGGEGMQVRIDAQESGEGQKVVASESGVSLRRLPVRNLERSRREGLPQGRQRPGGRGDDRQMRIAPKRILKRRPDPLEGSMGMALFETGKGGTTILITRRVGSVRKLPRGYELGECSSCKSPVWVNSGFMAHYRRGGQEDPGRVRRMRDVTPVQS